MSDQYRLVFAGEVAEGQHAAVVKKRLAGVLKLNDARMAVLFSGKSVVVKKAVDADNAARYQAVFAKAGAVLQVISPTAETAAPATTAPETTAPAQTKAASTTQGELDVLPVGADVLSPAERRNVDDADIDTSHLSLQGAVFSVDEPEAETDAPNVDHLTLAEAGARMGDEEELVVVEIDVDFTVAEVGALMFDDEQSDAERELAAAAADIESIDFDVAEPGAQMDTQEKKPPPPAPDTSHIQLDDD